MKSPFAVANFNPYLRVKGQAKLSPLVEGPITTGTLSQILKLYKILCYAHEAESRKRRMALYLL